MARVRGLGVLGLLWLLGLVLLGFTGCGGSGGDRDDAHTSRITLLITTAGQAPSNSLLRAEFLDEPGRVEPGDPDFITRLDIRVEVADITPPLTQSLTLTEKQQQEVTVELIVPVGTNRRILVTAFNEAEKEIFRGETTVDLTRDVEVVVLTLVRRFLPKNPTVADFANRSFTFADGAVFGISGTVTLAFGSFGDTTGPFTLTASGGKANGTVTISTSSAATSSNQLQETTADTVCVLTFTASSYPPGQGPQKDETSSLGCNVDEINGSLRLTREGTSIVSARPTPTPNEVPNGTIDTPAENVTIAAGEAVAFAATCSDPDATTPLRFAWDFGGGVPNVAVEDPGLVTFPKVGTFAVTLTCTDALEAADPTPDTRTVTVRGSSASIVFALVRTLAVGEDPEAVALSDMNGDGMLDMVVANQHSNDVSALLRNRDGTFQAARAFAAGDAPSAIAIGDFNGDGVLDIVTANAFANTVAVLLGNGDGTFQVARAFAAGSGPEAIALGDLNGDGKLDVVVANEDSDDVSVLLGNGDGTLQTTRALTAGEDPVAVALGDLNGDGKLDLVVANEVSHTIVVLLGNGDGTFQAARAFVANDPVAVALGDLNGDGKLDVVVANEGFDTVEVSLGNGDGTLRAARSFAVGSSPQAVTIGDLNGDGALDLVTANDGSNDVSVLLGNGDGTLQAARPFIAGPVPDAVAIGDLNSDGKPDLVVVNEASNVVSILLQTIPGAFPDTDGDGLIDTVEALFHTDPAKPDTDSDGLTDGAEVITHGTDPLDPDTDSDGVSDGVEVIAGSHPLNRASTPPFILDQSRLDDPSRRLQ